MFYTDFSYLSYGNIIFRVVAQALLLLNIRSSKNVAGVSGKTQILFATVMLIRCIEYSTLPMSLPDELVFVGLAVLFLLLAIATLYSIYKSYRLTYEAHFDEFNLLRLIIPSILMTLLWDQNGSPFGFGPYLELGAIFPQLYFCHKSKYAEKAVYNYVFLLMIAMGFQIFEEITDRRTYYAIRVLLAMLEFMICADFVVQYWRLYKPEINEIDEAKPGDNLKEVVLSPGMLIKNNEKVDVFAVPQDQNKNNDLPAKY